MTWFSDMTGIDSETHHNVNELLWIDGLHLMSDANQRRFKIGELTQPRLSALRSKSLPSGGTTSVTEIVADVQYLHQAKENAGAVFQVASQFNLLEMVSPSVRPEDGVGLYENDRTQGPACAIACGAGTIYRNYFVLVRGNKGQCLNRQIDCLGDIAKAIDNKKNSYWEMKNGYALPTPDGLERLNALLMAMTEQEMDHLRGLLRIGVHADTEVTLDRAGHCVTQIYCSAMPVSYGLDASDAWQPIATLILEAAYEATLRAAIQNALKTGNKRVFLTLLGGGAFGNRPEWIVNAILRALSLMEHSDLDIFLVSHGRPNMMAHEIIDRWSKGAC